MTRPAASSSSPQNLNLSNGMGSRVAEWLRSVYPHNTAKKIARDLACSHNTSAGWLLGRPPSGDHLARMVALWGRPFVRHITAQDVRSDIAKARRNAVRLKLRLAQGANHESTRQISDRQLDLFGDGGGWPVVD